VTSPPLISRGERLDIGAAKLANVAVERKVGQ
jgi:hypothetical protein